jgi:hypothetical protein
MYTMRSLDIIVILNVIKEEESASHLRVFLLNGWKKSPLGEGEKCHLHQFGDPELQGACGVNPQPSAINCSTCVFHPFQGPGSDSQWYKKLGGDLAFF